MINKLMPYAVMTALLTTFSIFAQNEVKNSTDESLKAALLQCRLEPSQLERLDCYDKLIETPQSTRPQIEKMGPTWRSAIAHESQREGHSTAFLVTTPKIGTYPVVMTTPALGFQPPRPILMLSCVDNITRMQLSLPVEQKNGRILLTTENTQFSTDWFLRENGYVLESSRGLSGIDEIKRIISGDKLTITLANGERLTFDTSQFAESIAPLRSACRW